MSSGTMTASWPCPDRTPSMRVGSWVSTSAPSTPWPVREPGARATSETCSRVSSVTSSRRSGNTVVACASRQAVPKVSSVVTKSSIAGTCSVPSVMSEPDLPSICVRSQYAASGRTS